MGIDLLSDTLAGGRRIRIYMVLDQSTRNDVAIAMDTLCQVSG